MRKSSNGRNGSHALRHAAAWLYEDIKGLLHFQPSQRGWHMPFAAALASGLPLLVGAYFNHMDYGLLSSLGGMVFLSLPETPLAHRMIMVMACAFAMTASFALGAMAHVSAPLMAPVLAIIATLVTLVVRFYRVGPPGSLFFVMACAIALFMPFDVELIPLRVGLVAMGGILACAVAFGFSLYMLRRKPPVPWPVLPPFDFGYVVLDSCVIGFFVGLSLALAQLLGLERPYWVPVSCMAIMQGVTLRAMWSRQVHRIVGTGLGLLLALGLLLLHPDKWQLCGLMMLLTLVVEYLVVRNYAIAAVFITPLTIFLAEAGAGAVDSPTQLAWTRGMDIVLGSVVGFAGGVCLHSVRFRNALEPWLRRFGRVRKWIAPLQPENRSAPLE